MTNRGRPRALADQQKRRTLFAMISIGAGLESAARHVGCSVDTVRREARRDEDFAQQLRDAETTALLMPLRMLRNAAGTHWRAAAWLLERCYPEQFARRKPETVSPAPVGTLLDDVVTIVDEICQDDAQRELIFEQLAELQQHCLGAAQAALQGPPQPKSDMDRFVEKFGREQDEALTALGPSSGLLKLGQRESLFPRES